MKLQARSADTQIFYPLTVWSFDLKRKQLIQRIPKIKELQINSSGAETISLKIPPHLLRPSLQTGQEIRLDDTAYYVAHIEVAPVQDYQAIYIYYLSEFPPEVPSFWTVDVEEEK